jgi:hypothetical protein
MTLIRLKHSPYYNKSNYYNSFSMMSCRPAAAAVQNPRQVLSSFNRRHKKNNHRLQTIPEHQESFHHHLFMGVTGHRRHLAFDDTVFQELILGRIVVPPPPSPPPPLVLIRSLGRQPV